MTECSDWHGGVREAASIEGVVALHRPLRKCWVAARSRTGGLAASSYAGVRLQQQFSHPGTYPADLVARDS